MNKTKAKEIAAEITSEQLAEMLENAKQKTTNWKEVSNVNASLTKGTVWNVLVGKFNVQSIKNPIHIVNLIREFGEFLPKDLLKRDPKNKRPPIEPIHQDPIF